jgi:hypothetical protein
MEQHLAHEDEERDRQEGKECDGFENAKDELVEAGQAAPEYENTDEVDCHEGKGDR